MVKMFFSLLILAVCVSSCALFQSQKTQIMDQCKPVCDQVSPMAAMGEAQCKPMCYQVLSRVFHDAGKVPPILPSVCVTSCQDAVEQAGSSCQDVCEYGVSQLFEAIEARR